MRWNIAAGILVLAVTALAMEAPTLTLAAIAAVALTIIFFVKPKFGAGLAVVVMLFGSSLSTATGIDLLGYLDEALVVLPFIVFTIRRLLHQQRLRYLPGSLWLGAYLALGAISGLVNEVPLLLASQSTFLMLKGFLFAFALAQIDWNTEDVRRLVRPSAWVVAIILLISVVNLAMPGAWASLLSRRNTGVDYRLGLPSLIGPFDHEVVYGQFMALAVIAIVAYRANVGKGWVSAVLLFGTAVGAILSFRRKAIVAAIAASFAALMFSKGKKLNAAVWAMLILPALVFVGWDAITSIVSATYVEYFYNPDQTARTVLHRDAVGLAAAAFPLGVGFGRFGSYMASQVYSPEYLQLGYPHIYGLAPGNRGPYLSDTFWPAILGESGFLGALAFLLAVLVMARRGVALAKTHDDKYVRWTGVVLAAWTVEFLIESVAAPVFNSPPLFVLLFGLAGMVAALSDTSEPSPVSTQPVRAVAAG